MIYRIEKKDHNKKALTAIFAAHPEIRFVSLVALDIYGNDTDEKIPVSEMMGSYSSFMKYGVQTDGSSVLLPKIADISNARVDLIPDSDAVWFIDYNNANIDKETGLPTATLRIPSYLVHNGEHMIGSRAILRDSLAAFKAGVIKAIKDNPYVLEYLSFNSADDIKEILLTSATEMEFYVMTPHELADKERLHASQQMKEQYWKRTIGPVRTALEKTLIRLEKAGLDVEMGHKEVGGVKPQLETSGLSHIMEQLEIDWKYDEPMQAADNDYEVRNLIRDTFRNNGLDVTFMAKPVEGVAGSGKHTHFGVAAKLKDGRVVNLFTALDPAKDYMSPIGYGALMGLLRNYEIVSPFVSATTDAFNRLKPGYEAPVCTVTSLGRGVDEPSRNRTVLAGLIRDINNPMATRFELRSPNPESNTYLVLAAGYMAILDGINKALAAKKTPAELEKSVSKKYGETDFYLEKNRVYRVENDIFADYSAKEREKLFGKSPATVWEALSLFDENPEKTNLLFDSGVMRPVDLDSFKTAALRLWVTELSERLIPKMRETCHTMGAMHHKDAGATDLDEKRWAAIDKARREIAQDFSRKKSLLTKLSDALDAGKYGEASKLSLEAFKKMSQLEAAYAQYQKNLFMW